MLPMRDDVLCSHSCSTSDSKIDKRPVTAPASNLML